MKEQITELKTELATESIIPEWQKNLGFEYIPLKGRPDKGRESGSESGLGDCKSPLYGWKWVDYDTFNQRYPKHNAYAIKMGAPANGYPVDYKLCVVDMDNPTLFEKFNASKFFNQTKFADSARKGRRHYYLLLKIPAGQEIGLKAINHVEIRAAKGYCVGIGTYFIDTGIEPAPHYVEPDLSKGNNLLMATLLQLKEALNEIMPEHQVEIANLGKTKTKKVLNKDTRDDKDVQNDKDKDPVINAIKKVATLPNFLEKHGIQHNGVGQNMKCPLGHETSGEGNFSIMSNWTYYCHHTGADCQENVKATLIGFAQKFYGLKRHRDNNECTPNCRIVEGCKPPFNEIHNYVQFNVSEAINELKKLYNVEDSIIDYHEDFRNMRAWQFANGKFEIKPPYGDIDFYAAIKKDLHESNRLLEFRNLGFGVATKSGYVIDEDSTKNLIVQKAVELKDSIIEDQNVPSTDSIGQGIRQSVKLYSLQGLNSLIKSVRTKIETPIENPAISDPEERRDILFFRNGTFIDLQDPVLRVQERKPEQFKNLTWIDVDYTQQDFEAAKDLKPYADRFGYRLFEGGTPPDIKNKLQQTNPQLFEEVYKDLDEEYERHMPSHADMWRFVLHKIAAGGINQHNKEVIYMRGDTNTGKSSLVFRIETIFPGRACVRVTGDLLDGKNSTGKRDIAICDPMFLTTVEENIVTHRDFNEITSDTFKTGEKYARNNIVGKLRGIWLIGNEPEGEIDDDKPITGGTTTRINWVETIAKLSPAELGRGKIYETTDLLNLKSNANQGLFRLILEEMHRITQEIKKTGNYTKVELPQVSKDLMADYKRTKLTLKGFCNLNKTFIGTPQQFELSFIEWLAEQQESTPEEAYERNKSSILKNLRQKRKLYGFDRSSEINGRVFVCNLKYVAYVDNKVNGNERRCILPLDKNNAPPTPEQIESGAVKCLCHNKVLEDNIKQVKAKLKNIKAGVVK